MTKKLTRLQVEVLDRFFEKEKRFFLTGGAALAGFYLGHRGTNDLDLFTTSAVLDEGTEVLTEIARTLDGSLESVRTSPDFRRFLLRCGTEAVVVDLVHDRVPQAIADKREVGEIRLDVPEEILANKLCSILSRAEIRDLVDVFALERAGYKVEDVVGMAMEKDGGLTPAQLSWVLSQISMEEGVRIPGDLAISELIDFVQDLIHRLTKMAFPAGDKDISQ
jgi:predicted nucleotidyltransferase component of viral defense system